MMPMAGFDVARPSACERRELFSLLNMHLRPGTAYIWTGLNNENSRADLAPLACTEPVHYLQLSEPALQLPEDILHIDVRAGHQW